MTQITLEQAERIIDAAKANAKESGTAVNIAVVDAAGNAVALARMNGTRPFSTKMALAKARTAAVLGRPSELARDMANTRPQLYEAIIVMVGEPLLPSGGGLPIFMSGELLGGVGVGGFKTPEEDVECARAGLDEVGAD